MRELDYVAPSSVREACLLLEEHDGALALAGGTDILVGLEAGKISPKLAVDLSRIPGLAGIEETAAAITVGALTTMTAVSRAEVVKRFFPALAFAAGAMGCWQVRNLATLGGNLCNASPSADTAPPLILYDAVALIDGLDGPREMPLAEFLTGPGCTDLSGGEILVGVRVSKPSPEFRSAYVRRALRKSMDIPIVNLAVGVTLDDGAVTEARLVLGAVATTPIRALEAERLLVGSPLDEEHIAAAAVAAAAASRPIDDVRASAQYRRQMIEVFTRRALLALAEGRGE
jgi:aerobic carbon-monoxide dehydrogenase medium subunit